MRRDPDIQAVVEMMEAMDRDTKACTRCSVEKEKLLMDLKQQMEDKKTG